MIMRDLIIFNMSHWKTWQQYVGQTRRPLIFQQTGLVNRNYHILHQLLKRPDIRRVLIVDLIPFTAKRTLRVWWESILGDVPGKNVTPHYFVHGGRSKVTEIAPGRYVYSTSRNLIQAGEAEAVWTEISSIIKTAQFENLLLWSYFPMYAKPFQELTGLKVFDAVDDWREHPYCRAWKTMLDKNYRLIDEKAGAIFTVSPQVKKIFGTNPNVSWQPNGIDYNHFQKIGHNLKTRLAKIKHPVIGYLGIIESRLDFDLLEKILQHFPSASLVLAGPVWDKTAIRRFKKYANLHLLGPIAYHDLPELYHSFDIAIIPHRITAFTKSMNPLKMYEYLACGLPVITTPVAGTEQFPGLVKQAQSHGEFLDAIKFYLDHPLSLTEQNRRRAAVRSYTWENRVEEMFKHLPHD